MGDAGNDGLVRMRRYGSDRPLPERHLLHAGPLEVTLENGDLRYIRVAGREIVRRLYVAVRNRNWDTIAPRFTRYDVESDGQSFSVRFTAVHDDGDVGFTWQGLLTGSAAGEITARMDGTVDRDFLRNRIGFCVLHPIELAGTAVEVQTPAGLVQGTLPTLISPHQPFVDMEGISHAVGESKEPRVSIRFSGDLFEMEDQRNWTDASYKTYGTPLRLDYPVLVRAGAQIAQTVVIEVTGSTDKEISHSLPISADVVIGSGSVGQLPPIGLGAAKGPVPSARALDLLRVLRLAHVRAVVDLTADDWAERLTRVTELAVAIGVALELEVLVGDDQSESARLGAMVAASTVPVARVLVFPAPRPTPRRLGLTTTADALATIRSELRGAGITVPIGGGSRAYFTELNRAEDLPLTDMDVVGYTINPQIHADDLLSMIETIDAQAATVISARAIAGDRPLVIGPITLKAPFNPNATGPETPVGKDQLPPSVDARQLSRFAAGWTVGSLRALASAGTASLTYFETIGWRGVIERETGLTRRNLFPSEPGMAFPVYHVFAALSDYAGADLLPVTLGDPLSVEAIAVRRGGQVRLLVANLTNDERTVNISASGVTFTSSLVLDDTSHEAAAHDPLGVAQLAGDPVLATGALELTLDPFALARVDGWTAGGTEP